MKTKRFSVEQIVAILTQAELGLPVAELIRQVGISEQTFCHWKTQYVALESDQVRELKQVVEERASGLRLDMKHRSTQRKPLRRDPRIRMRRWRSRMVDVAQAQR